MKGLLIDVLLQIVNHIIQTEETVIHISNTLLMLLQNHDLLTMESQMIWRLTHK